MLLLVLMVLLSTQAFLERDYIGEIELTHLLLKEMFQSIIL